MGPWFPPGRIPELGFWVADGIFRVLAPSQAGSWVNAALQAPGGVFRLADCFKREMLVGS